MYPSTRIVVSLVSSAVRLEGGPRTLQSPPRRAVPYGCLITLEAIAALTSEADFTAVVHADTVAKELQRRCALMAVQKTVGVSMIGQVSSVQGSAGAGGRQREKEARGIIHPARPPAYLAAGAADAGCSGHTVVTDDATARERGRPQGARASEPTGALRIQGSTGMWWAEHVCRYRGSNASGSPRGN